MKVIAFSIKPFEKELLEKVNQNKHDINFISKSLSLETIEYANGYDAIIVFTNDNVSARIVNKLAELGIKYIATRSVGTDHIDIEAAKSRGIRIKNVPEYSPQAVAEHAVALAMALSRKIIPTYESCKKFNFTIDEHIGFNFYKKTVGIIGLGNIGQAAAAIFNGLGCRVLGYDVVEKKLPGINKVDLDTIIKESDIISLHVPLNQHTHYLIDKTTIAEMKTGVMLINTSRGSVINTVDVLNALLEGKIGYLGLDVYEFEKGLFFENHESDKEKDPLLTKLMGLPNVIVTPHQAFLTKEAIQEIATHTIENLDKWEK